MGKGTANRYEKGTETNMDLVNHFKKGAEHHERLAAVHDACATAHQKLAAQSEDVDVAQQHRDLRAAHQKAAKLHGSHAEHLATVADEGGDDSTKATEDLLSAEDRAFLRKLVAIDDEP